MYVPIKMKDKGFGLEITNTSKIFKRVNEQDGYWETKMREGIFYISKKESAWSNKYDDNMPAQIIPESKPKIVVSKESILDGVIPPFNTGYGCCDYSLGEPLKCSCGVVLGGMYLDCYEDGCVKFDIKKVNRVY
jgi:hypothetical protein